jgi:hypothetical protein
MMDINKLKKSAFGRKRTLEALFFDEIRQNQIMSAIGTW